MRRFTKSLLLTTAIVVALAPAVWSFAATPDNAALGFSVRGKMSSTSSEALAAVAHVQAAHLAHMMTCPPKLPSF